MKVLVGIDGGSQQQAALALAAQLARGGELVVVNVYPWAPSAARLGTAYAKSVEDDAAAILASAAEQLPGVTVETRAIADLHTGRALHDAAIDTDADVIVIGACHRGAVGRAVLGGTGESVVHGSPRPVVVAPRDFVAGVVRTVGVAYDGRPESEAALTWAQHFAEQTGATLRLLGAVTLAPLFTYPGFAVPPDQAILEEMRADTRRQMVDAIERLPESVQAEAVVLDGAAVPSLLEAAKTVNVMVAGSRGYGPVGTVLMGSVSRALTHAAPCPVVVVPRGAEIEHVAGGDPATSASVE